MNALQVISGALDGHLNTMASLPPVAWPNSDYDPQEGTAFLSVNLLSGAVGNIDLQYLEEHRGIYQVTVSGPAGKYKAETEALADAVVNHFLGSRELTYNGATIKIQSASFGFGLTDDAWYQIPVSIDYKVFIQR